MKTPDVIPFEPAEKRRVLRTARDTGVLHYDDLDRLLVHACDSKPRMHALLRSLKDVVVVDARNPDDILYGAIDSQTEAASASSDDYRLYAEQVRSLRRLTRSEEVLQHASEGGGRRARVGDPA